MNQIYGRQQQTEPSRESPGRTDSEVLEDVNDLESQIWMSELLPIIWRDVNAAWSISCTNEAVKCRKNIIATKISGA